MKQILFQRSKLNLKPKWANISLNSDMIDMERMTLAYGETQKMQPNGKNSTGSLSPNTN
ncbi:hypothetical protein SAMN04487898_11329 [Pedobacter sp. ok626]|nr:hypothetical protein SAMN04487898_11329 [Pedobacter sp. ok626]